MRGYCTAVAPALLRDCEDGGRARAAAPDLIFVGMPTRADGDALGAVHPSLVGSGAARAAQARRHGSAEAAASRPPAISHASPAFVEIAKLALNCFVTRAKFAFAHFVADVADATDAASARALPASGAEGAAHADKHAILEAFGCDARVGPRCLLAGYGYGGPCFPRDTSVPEATAARASRLTTAPPPSTRASSALTRRCSRRRTWRTTRTCFSDVAYKPRCPVHVVVESQKLRVARLVRDAGWAVLIKDRPVVLDAVRREHGSVYRYRERPVRERANGDAYGEIDGESFLRPHGHKHARRRPTLPHGAPAAVDDAVEPPEDDDSTSVGSTTSAPRARRGAAHAADELQSAHRQLSACVYGPRSVRGDGARASVRGAGGRRGA